MNDFNITLGTDKSVICVSVVDLIRDFPLSAATRLSKPLYALLCSLRDMDGAFQLIDSSINEDALVRYFSRFPGSRDLRDQLDYVSALCSDSELNLLTRVMLRVSKTSGVPGLAL
jgi:hypothetical protein